jgi:hypothetical protein
MSNEELCFHPTVVLLFLSETIHFPSQIHRQKSISDLPKVCKVGRDPQGLLLLYSVIQEVTVDLFSSSRSRLILLGAIFVLKKWGASLGLTFTYTSPA